MELGNYLKQQRESNGYTQQDLADRLYLTRQTISSWEQGKSYPDIERLVTLSNFYSISLDQLIKGDVKMVEKLQEDFDVRSINKSVVLVNVMALVVLVVGQFAPMEENLKDFVNGFGYGLILLGTIVLILVNYNQTVLKSVINFKKKFKGRG